MFKTIVTLFALLVCASAQSWEWPEWQCPKGKIDVGAAFIDVDVLESGKTVETLHMVGVKADLTVLFYKGWFIEPNIIWAQGDGRLVAGTIGIGHYFPIGKRLTILPSVGWGFSHLHNEIDLPTPLGKMEFTRKFHSTSPYISLKVNYQLAEKFYVFGYVQYAWSSTKTTLVHLLSDKSHSEGPNYAVGVEYSVTPKWSITAGVAYNISLSHEKHGLRAKGAKIGVSYYF